MFDIEDYRKNIGKLYRIKDGHKDKFITPTGDSDDLFVVLRVVFDPEVGDTATYALGLPQNLREDCFWDCRLFHKHYEEVA